MVRAGDRPVYFPVLFVQPNAGNERAFGMMTCSASSNRRAALMNAAATGELTATQRITLVMETQGQFGILILRPVYRPCRPFLR